MKKNIKTIQKSASDYMVVGRQGNHYSWRMPEELEESGNMPLWLAVASWAFQLDKPVTRDDISYTFHISPRRAADVMTYIIRNHIDVIQIKKKIVRVDGRRRIATFLVTSITARLDAKTRPRASKILSGRGNYQ